MESDVPIVPIVGADSAEFVRQLAGPDAIEGFRAPSSPTRRRSVAPA